VSGREVITMSPDDDDLGKQADEIRRKHGI
jgi:hypothetical protein